MSVLVVVAAAAALAFADAAAADGGPLPSPFPTPIAAKPDLAFTSATTTGFTLKNYACSPLLVNCFPRGGPAGPFWVTVHWDAGAFGSRTSWLYFSSLAEGASVSVDYAAIGLVPFDQPCGSLVVTADVLNQVAERSESNNSASTTVGSYFNCV
jgi:hypothetical protein